MSLIPNNLNGLPAFSVKLTFPWRGVWTAEIDLNVEVAEAILPLLQAETPSILTVGDTPLVCTIDPKNSGIFAGRAHAKVIGGRGGWEKTIPAQDFYNPAGALVSTIVYAASAAIVGEVVLDPTPQILGEHFSRVKGATSKIFGDRQWFVEPLTGVATVADWPPRPPDPEWSIIDYAISESKVSAFSDKLILPGTVIADARFGPTTFIARDVVQHFDADMSNAEIWVSEKPCSRLQSAFSNAVREFANTSHLKVYRYRYVIPVGGQLALQAITPGAPDLNPIEQWTGLSGIKAELAGVAALAPATEILVGFTADTPPQPYLASFSSLAKPLGITLSPTTFVNVGVPTSPVALSVGTLAAITALQAEVAAMGVAWAALGALTGPIVGAMIQPIAAPVATAVAAGTAAVIAASAITPSHKLLSE